VIDKMEQKFRLVVFSNGSDKCRFVLYFNTASDLELGRNVIARSFLEEQVVLKPEFNINGSWVDFELPN
jgi:hypothetical protein